MPKSKSAKAPKHAFTSLRPAATTKDERIVSERQSGIRTHKLEIVISLLRRPEAPLSAIWSRRPAGNLTLSGR
jgi:hypothetical protein